MEKKVLSLVIIMCMALSMAACGSKAEDVGTETTENIEEVVENIRDEEAGVTEAPEDNSGDEVIENETIKDFVDETDNKVEDTKDETSTSESSEDVSVIEPGVVEEPTNGNEGNGDANVEPNLGGDNGNGGNETTPVETPPAVEPEPTTPVTPPSSGNGDNLSFSGSTTLPSGLTINTLNEFNNSGMSLENGNSWMGDIYSDIVAQNYETMADNFDAFNAMYSGSVINVTNGEQIWWRSSMANSSAAIELRRSGDHYKLIISSPLLDDATAESLGWMSGREAEAREALTVLLSTISSTPQSLSDAIVDSIYNTNSPVGQEPIKADGNWASIGDCRIRVGAYDFENGNHMVVFRIAP